MLVQSVIHTFDLAQFYLAQFYLGQFYLAQFYLAQLQPLRYDWHAKPAGASVFSSKTRQSNPA